MRLIETKTTETEEGIKIQIKCFYKKERQFNILLSKERFDELDKE